MIALEEGKLEFVWKKTLWEREKILVTSIVSLFKCFQKPSSSRPLTFKRQILHFSKLEGFADDNFKFDVNGRTFSKWVENNVGKGEIAHCNFPYSHSVIKRLVLQTCINQGLFGKGLSHYW